MWHSRNKLTLRTVLCCTIIILILYCGYQQVKMYEMGRDIDTQKHIDDENEDYLETDIDDTTANQTTLPSKHKPFPELQSYEEVEFPTIARDKPRIPHVIHQIFTHENVPDLFKYPMRSFVQHNPTWKYMFWTYASGRKLLVKKYTYLVNIYDAFGENDVKKADLLRFAIVYEYGGVYADVDVMNLRPLNITTMKYACILSTEPFEHSIFLHGKAVIISNAILLCRPKHPFFRQLLLHLKLADTKGHPVSTTGPGYTTQMYMLYNNLSESDLLKDKTENSTNSPYFYKGTRNEDDDDAIYIPNTQYFMDNVDSDMLNDKGELDGRCNGTDTFNSPLEQRCCTEFQSRKQIRKNKTFTFMLHYWFHLWCKDSDKLPRMHIKDIIPECILYED